MLLLMSFLGCVGDPPAEDTAPVLAACGNGLVESDEQCDDGAANSDTTPDACRTSCRLPGCGDAVQDVGEACDDGNGWGGDGCTADCVIEDGELEVEPNDSWDAGQALSLSAGEGRIHGALPDKDRDCFTFPVSECHAVSVSQDGSCPVPVVLSLHDPLGAQVAASGFTGECAVIDPIEEPGARFIAEGTWAVCAEGLLGEPVPSYSLSVLTADSADFDIQLSTVEDFDGDGLLDSCDGDRDGDGVDNEDDNCPDIPNGPENIIPTVDTEGFIRHWLSAAPFTGESSPDSCLPTTVERTGDDAMAAPEIGDVADGLPWEVFISNGGHIELTRDYGDVDPPREAYLATYVHSDSERALTLGLGPDDGARVWLNGTEVLSVRDCQGVSPDRFTAEVTLQAGVNRLLVKVYDQGGGWGTYVRFLDGELPVTDLELSLSPLGGWPFDQTDSDGDGLGDICDPD